MDQFKRATPGDPMSGMPAEVYNLLLDLLKDHRHRFPSSEFSDGKVNLNHDLELQIRNESGGDLPQYSIVGLAGKLVGPGETDTFHFGNLVYSSRAPKIGKSFAILQRPAEAGGVVKALASGLTLARVNFVVGNHRYAYPVDDDYLRLSSTGDDAAPVSIVKRLDGDWCLVNICCQIDGVDETHGTGELENQPVTCSGSGTFTFAPGGFLSNPAITCSGSGTSTPPERTATGTLANQAATCNGLGKSLPPPPFGYWVNRAVLCSGTGTFTQPKKGTGKWNNKAVICTGHGEVTPPTRTGSGALVNQPIVCVGTGTFTAPLYATVGAVLHFLITGAPTLVNGLRCYPATQQDLDTSDDSLQDAAFPVITGSDQEAYLFEENDRYTANGTDVQARFDGVDEDGKYIYRFEITPPDPPAAIETINGDSTAHQIIQSSGLTVAVTNPNPGVTNLEVAPSIVAASPFPVKITGFPTSYGSPALWAYPFVEQERNTTTGAWQDKAGGRTGKYLLEANNTYIKTPAYQEFVKLTATDDNGHLIYGFDRCCTGGVTLGSGVHFSFDVGLAVRVTKGFSFDIGLAARVAKGFNFDIGLGTKVAKSFTFDMGLHAPVGSGSGAGVTTRQLSFTFDMGLHVAVPAGSGNGGGGSWTGSQTFDGPGINTTWTAPAGATEIRVTCYGAGSKNVRGAGTLLQGGGGGGYAQGIHSVTAGDTFTVQVEASIGSLVIDLGAAFARNDNSYSISATGGNNTADGAGGVGSTTGSGWGSVVTFTGGAGGTGSGSVGGGGGGGAGPSGNGTDGTNASGSTPGTGGASGGGDAGAGGNGSNGGNGADGSDFGGGGGGGTGPSGGTTSGSGKDPSGKARIIVEWR